VVFGHGGDAAQLGGDGGQLGRGQKDIGVLAQPVGEVARAGRDHRGALAHLRLVAHAQAAAGHFGARTGGAEVGVVALFHQLAGVHLGGWGHPELDRDVALAAEQLGRGAEVPDVGHARADEGLVDRRAGHVRQHFGVVRVVGAAQDRLFDFGQIDLDHGGVFGVGVGAQQLGLLEPLLHALDAPRQRLGVLVAVGDHVLHQHDVAVEVFDHRLGVELDRAAGGRALGAGVGQLKRLLDLELGQAFDFEDAAREDVFLARFGHRQQSGLDGVERDGVHQVAQRHAGLHLALEAHQHRFGHVQRHDAGGGAKGHQTGAGREADADREAGVRVAPGAHGVGQQQAVEPAVDHAVAGAQRHAAAAADEGRQLAVHFGVHRFRVGGRVAERLHHQIGRKTQASEVFEFVARHRAGGVLAADGGHARFAVGAGAHALAFGQAHGATDHFLRQRKALAAVHRRLGQAEGGGSRQTQKIACLGGERAPDDQVDAAAGAHFVEQHLALELELGHGGAVFHDLAGVGQDVDHVAHLELADIDLDRQRARVFLGVEKDRGNFAAQRHTAKALVGHEGDVLAGGPDHRVGGRFAARAGAHHVAYVGHEVAFFLEVFDELHRAALAVFFGPEGRVGAGVFEHRQVVQRDVGAAPGVGRGREVVGVGFAGHLEHGDGDFLWHFGAAGEPLGSGPALHHGLGVGVAGLGLGGHVVEEIKHQQRLLEPCGGHGRHLGVVEELDQRVHVVAAHHGAQQLGGLGLADQADCELAMRHSG